MKAVVNPIVWAMWGGFFGVGIATIASLSGNPMPQDIMACGMGGLFWAWVAANVRNWLWLRHQR